MRHHYLRPSLLLVAPWLATPAAAQVSRTTQVVAPGAIQAVVPTKVGTASLLGLEQLSLPPGTKAFVASDPTTSLTSGPSSGTLYHLEQRDGKMVLVATKYDKVSNKFGVGTLKASEEYLYPGDTRLLYTGPWVTGTFAVGLKTGTISGFAAYLLRPLDVSVRTAAPRATTIAATTLIAGAVTPPKTGTPASPTTVALVKPQPSGQDCGVKFNPESLSDPAQVRGLVCLLLTQDGQGMTLPDGTKLFVRYGGIERWKGDEKIDGSSGLVARDGAGRYWFLEPMGWMY